MKKARMTLIWTTFSALVLAAVLFPAFLTAPVFKNPGTGDDASLSGRTESCTNILIGREATEDGSTIGTYSCDGPPYGAIQVIPAESFPPGTLTAIHENKGHDSLKDYLDSIGNLKVIGSMPQVRETYAYINTECCFDHEPSGGVNRYGLTTGESTIGGRPELMNSKGLLWAYSNSKNSALLAIALQRAKTAREAIRVMGSLAEKYGYAQTREHLTVTDEKEVWAFEIFGPGADWTPGSGKSGAVWCAQRIPDGQVGVCANRSRIAEIDLNRPDSFMASPNVHSLAIEKGWWNSKNGNPFVWREAYAKPTRGERGSIIREWRILSLVAPSLKLDINAGRFPFSVKPDKPLSIQDVIAIHRDTLQGTRFDLTENAAFYIKGEKGPEKSPMASPFGPLNLHKLLRVSSERMVGTDTSCFVSIAQVRADLPDPVKACLWFTLGPAWSGCFAPIYSGCSKLSESWAGNNHARIVRGEAMWALKLAHELSYINYQNAAKDIRAVRDPVEAHFFAQRRAFEKAALDIYQNRGETAARLFVTNYTNACLNSVADGYWDLVDYLLFTYYFRSGWKAPQKLPVIQLVTIEP